DTSPASPSHITVQANSFGSDANSRSILATLTVHTPRLSTSPRESFIHHSLSSGCELSKGRLHDYSSTDGPHVHSILKLTEAQPCSYRSAASFVESRKLALPDLFYVQQPAKIFPCFYSSSAGSK
ncbi:hypothetical protein HDU82_006899, partial [Entophlyctis luteolus]